MNAFEIEKSEKLLQKRLEEILTKACIKAINDCRKLNSHLQEPDIVASIVLNTPSDMYDILKYFFPNDQFSISGIFCHQRPYVDIGLSKNSELGDVLFAFAYTNSRGMTYYNSLLLQAKMSIGDTLKIYPNEQHQLELYAEWPKFKYIHSGMLNGIVRDILPKTINNGAKYLIISTPYNHGNKLGIAMPEEVLHRSNNLAVEIVSFLKFEAGRPFEGKPNCNDDWSNMVWDLLRVSNQHFSNRRNSGLTHFPREIIAGNDFVKIADENFESSIDVRNESEHFYGRQEDIGIPLILIECKEDRNLDQIVLE